MQAHRNCGEGMHRIHKLYLLNHGYCPSGPNSRYTKPATTHKINPAPINSIYNEVIAQEQLVPTEQNASAREPSMTPHQPIAYYAEPQMVSTSGNPPSNYTMTDLITALKQVTRGEKGHTMPQFDAPIFKGLARVLEQWLQDLDEYSKCMNWDEELKLSTLPMLLQQRAKQIYQDLAPNRKTTWNQAMAGLAAHFGLIS